MLMLTWTADGCRGTVDQVMPAALRFACPAVKVVSASSCLRRLWNTPLALSWLGVLGAGCEDWSIAVWSLESRQEVARWVGHTGLPAALKWAPRRMLVASADSNLALWIPNLQELDARGIQWLQ